MIMPFVGLVKESSPVEQDGISYGVLTNLEFLEPLGSAEGEASI